MVGFKMKRLSLTLAAVILTASVPSVNTVSAAPTPENVLEIGFEDVTAQGVVCNGCNAEVTSENSHSGKYSLLVRRTEEWGDSTLEHVEKYLRPDTVYEINIGVMNKKPGSVSSNFNLDVLRPGREVYTYTASYDFAGPDSGWIKLTGWLYIGSEEDVKNLSVTVTNWNSDEEGRGYSHLGMEWYIDDISIRPTNGESAIENATRLPSLKEIYKDYFLIGNNSQFINETPYKQFNRHHFNSATTMHVRPYSPGKGMFDFDAHGHNNTTTAYNEADIPVHGHFLLQNVSFEDYYNWLVKNPDGSLLTRAEAAETLSEYINAIMKYYAGKMSSWDVMNEMIYDEPGVKYKNWKDAVSTSFLWFQAFANGAKKREHGADFIETAYRLARAADPGATLYYNENDLENQDKVTILVNMIDDINKRWLAEGNDRLLIEGIGFQSHSFLFTDPADVERTIQRFIELGLDIHISEYDVTMAEHWNDFNAAYLTDGPTREMLDKQAEVYAKTMIIYKKYSDHIKRVTIWGAVDSDHRGSGIFFSDYTPKPAYFALADPEGYLAGKYNTAKKREKWIKDNSDSY
jgi:endo-1,4-beta-xylanase